MGSIRLDTFLFKLIDKCQPPPHPTGTANNHHLPLWPRRSVVVRSLECRR